MIRNFDMKKSLENRQENLIFLLKNKKDTLELEKQHQIYGAIKEIDYMLSVLKYAEEEENEEEEASDQIPMVQQIHAVEKIPERKFKIPLRLKYEKS